MKETKRKEKERKEKEESQRISRACNGPKVWAGPGRAENFENVMDRAGPGREF